MVSTNMSDVLPPQIKAEIEQFKSQGVEMEEKRKGILRGLESELAEVTERSASFDARYSAVTKVLDQLKTGIDSVFSKIGCDASTIMDMLGGHASVTDTTVLQYLGIVEQRTNELLQLQAFIQAKESNDPEMMSEFLMGRGPRGALAASSFVIPSTGDDYDSDSEAEEEGKPLTQEELRARAMKGISRREAKKPPPSSSQQGGPPATTPAKTRGGTAASEKRKKGLSTR